MDSSKSFFWWLTLITGAFFSFYTLLKREKINLFLILFPFMILGLLARRHLPFYFLTLFYLLFNFSSFFKNSWRLKIIKIQKTLAFVFLLVVFFLFSLPRLILTFKINSSWQNYCQGGQVVYPCEAVKFLQRQPPANIFNRYEWGGLLIWQLPGFKVFVDGRMPAWPTPQGKSPYTIYLETLQTKPGWEKILLDYNITWILISPGTFMDLKLKPNPQVFGWQEVYKDKVAVIYKKN